MEIYLYNTLTRKKEIFKSINRGEVGIYTCGPTVYWYQHIGNLRSYIFSDILRRVLEFNNYKVNHIINVTDVGHLTSDADSGEDKIEKAASKEGKTAYEISHFYFNEFLDDFNKLNIKTPIKWTWASEHIEEQINLIKKLEEKGYTYRTEDGIYFDTSKFSEYGKLSQKKIQDLEAGKRIDMRDKKNKTDFALWKFSEESTKRQQEWDSPWGIGFPGWHIECSAMSSKYLGEHFDIHTGGEDHISIHHENEIAQSECAFGVNPWVNYWMHGAFLQIEGGKMSKSSGKIQTISELEKQNSSPLSYRYFVYSAHYRKPLTWSIKGLENAQNSYKKLKIKVQELKDDGKLNEFYLKKFQESINDDLNIPNAVAVLYELISDEKAEGKVQTIKRMDEIFALDLFKKEEIIIPEEILKLAELRQMFRIEKNFEKSDELRDSLKDKGWIVKDLKDNFELEKI